MNSSIKKIGFAVSGLASLILGIVCYCLDVGSYQYNVQYGGDAYTGIQNAAAQTACNVADLAGICKFGLGSILLIAGLVLIICAVTYKEKEIRDYSVPFGDVYHKLGRIENLIDERCVLREKRAESENSDKNEDGNVSV